MFFSKLLNEFLLKSIFLSTIHFVSAFSIEELKDLNYEVDISEIPVKREEMNQQAVYITSKIGQEFQCILPQLNEEDISEKEVVNEKDADVIELLKPMKSGSCLSKGKDWWTYEFCFGHHIKQFHVEDGEIIGEIITLGLYESDYVWNNETDQEKFKHTKQKYHSQYYTNGTKCDITGQPRNAEIRIYCEEDAGDYIYRVDEPGTCSYIITVHTSRICSHPLLKPLPSNKAHSITCHPLLNEEQYTNYLQKLKEEKALAEEKRSQWLSNQQERLQVMKNENLSPVDDKTENSLTDNSKLMNAKSTKDKHEMVRSFLLEEFDKEMEKLKASLPPEKFTLVKNDMQKQFDTILDEAKDDFNSELGDDAKDVAKLSSVTLNMLLEKLDKAEKDVVKATKELNKARSAISDEPIRFEDCPDIQNLVVGQEGRIKCRAVAMPRPTITWEKNKRPVKSDRISIDEFGLSLMSVSEEDEGTYSLEAFVKETGNHLVKKIQVNVLKPGDDSPKKESNEMKENKDTLKITSNDQSRTAVLDDDKLQVRIRRLDRKSSDASGKLHEMDFEQRKKLEQAVKEKLEKAGLDTGGRRIEVKIITAGYYDNEDGKDFQSLTDEETDQFHNMIMALLTGQQEAVQEMKRHKKLEENYKFTWEDGEDIDNRDD